MNLSVNLSVNSSFQQILVIWTLFINLKALNTIGRHVPNVLVFNFLPPKNQRFKGFYSQKSTFSKKDPSPGFWVKAF